MKRAKKGEWGYFASSKKRKLLQMLIMFAIPALIIISGILYFNTKQNLLTIVGMVGMIPAAMSCVSFIMFMMCRSLPEEEYRAIAPHEGDLTVAYELYMTSEKKNSMVDCLVICGNEVVGYITDPKTDAAFAREHLTKMLRADGFKVNVHMLTDLRPFTDRMDSLNTHAEELRKGISYKPDPAYEGYGREDMIRHTALNISL